MKNYVYPADVKGIVDVTKPPYNCDNTGKTDCTKALRAAIDDIFKEYYDAFCATVKKLDAMPGKEAWIGFEIRRVNGKRCIVWPEKLPMSKIIYFPNGTYLVSDTISYSFEHFRNIFNNGSVFGDELPAAADGAEHGGRYDSPAGSLQGV